MRPLLLLAASALALTTAACTGGAGKPRAALDCPQTQGALTRTGVAADRKSCTYVTDEGAEVTLQLVAVQGGPDATLQALETRLLAEAAQAGPATAKAAPPVPPGPTAAAETALNSAQSARDAAAVEREAMADARGAGVTVKVDADDDGGPGVIVDEENERVKVDLPGIHVDADEASNSARVRIGPFRIDAGDGLKTFRMRQDVRLKGEQLSPEKRGIRATFISEASDPSSRYRFVAYEAAGPKVGPLTVAVVKTSTEIEEGGRVHRDIKRLVRKNGGV